MAKICIDQLNRSVECLNCLFTFIKIPFSKIWLKSSFIIFLNFENLKGSTFFIAQNIRKRKSKLATFESQKF